MAKGSTKLLTEMSTRNISWGGKVGQCVGLTTLYHLHVPNVLKCGSLNFLQPSGPVMGLLYLLISLPQKCQQVFSLHRYMQVLSLHKYMRVLSLHRYTRVLSLHRYMRVLSSSEHFLVLHSITVTYSSLLSNVLLYTLFKTPYIHYVLVSHLHVSWTNLLCHMWSSLPRV
jgi:hypothetical protein